MIYYSLCHLKIIYKYSKDKVKENIFTKIFLQRLSYSFSVKFVLSISYEIPMTIINGFYSDNSLKTIKQQYLLILMAFKQKTIINFLFTNKT